MKKIIVIIFCGLAFIMQSFQTDKQEERKMAQLAYQCIRKNDSAGFKKMFVTAVEFASIVDGSSWPDNQKREVKQKLTQRALDSLIPQTFRDTRNKYKLDWNKAVVDSVVTAPGDMDGLKMIKWAVYFKVNGTKYELTANNGFKTPGGWKMGDHLNIYERDTK